VSGVGLDPTPNSTKESIMRKLMLAAIALGIPATAFAAHATSCCGNVLCCLLKLGCCH
jgi:hypothetical protein